MDRKEMLMEFDYMYKNTVCSHVSVDKSLKVTVTDYADNFIFRAFGTWGNEAKLSDIDNLFEERCFPRTRANAKELLDGLGLPFYDALAIVRITHGVMAHDNFWIRFDDEKHLTWEEVRKIVDRRWEEVE